MTDLSEVFGFIKDFCGEKGRSGKGNPLPRYRKKLKSPACSCGAMDVCILFTQGTDVFCFSLISK